VRKRGLFTGFGSFLSFLLSLPDTVARFEIYEFSCFWKVYKGWSGDRLLLLNLQGGDRPKRFEKS
jgi:hypothetical protein